MSQESDQGAESERILLRSLAEIETFNSDPESHSLDEAWEVYSSQPVIIDFEDTSPQTIASYQEKEQDFRINLLWLFCTRLLGNKLDRDEFDWVSSSYDVLDLAEDQDGKHDTENYLRFADILTETTMYDLTKRLRNKGLIPHSTVQRTIMIDAIEGEPDLLELINVPHMIKYISLQKRLDDILELGTDANEFDNALNWFLSAAMQKLNESQHIVGFAGDSKELVRNQRDQIGALVDVVIEIVKKARKLPPSCIGKYHEFEWMLGVIAAKRIENMPEIGIRPALEREDYVMHGGNGNGRKTNVDHFVAVMFARTHQTPADATYAIQLKASKKIDYSDVYDTKNVLLYQEEKELFQYSRIIKRLEKLKTIIVDDESADTEVVEEAVLPTVWQFITDQILERKKLYAAGWLKAAMQAIGYSPQKSAARSPSKQSHGLRLPPSLD